MSTTSIANDDTRHEGIQLALEILHDRRSELGRMIDGAIERGDYQCAADLDTRHAETCHLLCELRALAREVAA
jgi:hypothetical protein